MAIGTYKAYKDRLLKMKSNVYINGKKVEAAARFYPVVSNNYITKKRNNFVQHTLYEVIRVDNTDFGVGGFGLNVRFVFQIKDAVS